MPGKAAELTHLDDSGRPRMVDVGEKAVTRRQAVARGRISLSPATLAALRQRALKKGDALAVAELAGLMAAKRTHELIPLCHPLALSHIEVKIDLTESGAEILATVKSEGKTGVEMEALAACSVAALTIYDMCKAIDKTMVISDIRLLKKEGGRSGSFVSGA